MRFLTIGGLLAIVLMAGCASEGGGVECEDQECFAEQGAQCQAAQYTTMQAADVVARYTVEGLTAKGCRIQLRYTENPNPDGLSEAQRGEAFYGTDRLTRLAAERRGRRFSRYVPA